MNRLPEPTMPTAGLPALTRLVSALGTVSALAVGTHTYHYNVDANSTLYLHLEHAALTIERHDAPSVIITARLPAALVWRIATEQDDAGVYLVVQRRRLTRMIALHTLRASFHVAAPRDAHFMLRLSAVHLAFQDVTGVIDVPPSPERLILPQHIPE